MRLILNMVVTYPDGRLIWSIYADVLHDDLCNPNGILHNKIKSDLNFLDLLL